MTPAVRPPERRDDVRLLVIDPVSGAMVDGRYSDLPALLRPGDLVVVNDAATLPGSLRATTGEGDALEIRLLGPTTGGSWRAVLFGDGDWRDRTEERGPPPTLAPGDRLLIAGGAVATVAEVSPASPRMVDLAVDEAALLRAIYVAGAPIQYAHLAEPLELWSVQTVYAGRPWAAEMPSAGRPITWQLIDRLRAAGVGVASLTHAAGISSTGDPALDALLPLPERYEIPKATAAAIAATTGRVIAIGTSVVRALESAALPGGGVRAGAGETELVIGPEHQLRVAGGIVSGIHEPGESHYELLRAFADRSVLDRAFHRAVRLGYRGHELGDATLILPGVATARAWTSSSATASRAHRTGASSSPSRPQGSLPTHPTFRE